MTDPRWWALEPARIRFPCITDDHIRQLAADYPVPVDAPDNLAKDGWRGGPASLVSHGWPDA